MTTKLTFGNHSREIPFSLDEVGENFESYAQQSNFAVVLQDSTGRHISVPSETVIDLLKDTVKEKLAFESPFLPIVPNGMDWIGLKVGDNYGLLILDQRSHIVYRQLDPRGNLYRKAGWERIGRNLVREWWRFRSMGDNEFARIKKIDDGSLGEGMQSGYLYRCWFPECEYESEKKYNWQRHVMGHLGLPPLECLRCGYETLDSGSLSRHQCPAT